MRITGDPAVLLAEPGASAADLDAIRQQFGLDRPLWTQYVSFLTHLVRGDFGQSFYYRTDVFELYLSRLPASLLLASAAMAFSLLVGIPTGIIAAVRVNQWWDSGGKIFALLGLSMPSFWVGLLMILFFSVYLGWLPSSGSGTVFHLVMPAISLGWLFAAVHMRLTRSSMLDVLGSEYVKLARLKGLPEALVISKQPRDHGQRCGRRGDRLRLAGRRPPALRGHRLPRFPGRAGDGSARRRDDRRRQSPRGHPVRRHRPEDQI
jgi:peptide/nickel transport system permease protein